MKRSASEIAAQKKINTTLTALDHLLTDIRNQSKYAALYQAIYMLALHDYLSVCEKCNNQRSAARYLRSQLCVSDLASIGIDYLYPIRMLKKVGVKIPCPGN